MEAHRSRLSAALLSGSLGLILLAAGVFAPALAQQADTPAEDPPAAATPLNAFNDVAANPALVATVLQVPPGFAGHSRSVALPAGFSISLLAAGLSSPRFMAFDDAGGLLVADQSGAVYRYTAGALPSGSPPGPLLAGLNAPSSLALRDGYLYVGETNRVTRFPYDPAGPPGAGEVVVPSLPTGGHATRTVVFGPDGLMYVGVGSSCNICDERDERRAAILRYLPDGSGYERFAWGLRNPVGLAIQPDSGLLWTTVNERDYQGDEIPPDLLTAVQEGQQFGWPHCLPPAATPQQTGADCSGITPPSVALQAHSAPLGLAFYAATQFPSDYQGDAFVAQHGSWNRQPPSPPKLLRVHFQDGVPAAASDFATGWQTGDGGRWGRLAGVIVAPDGSLVVSDDQAGVLYRISYGG